MGRGPVGPSVAAVGREGLEADGCRQAVASVRFSSACPLGQGRVRANGWARYSPRQCGPLTSGPQPQCRGLNFPNRSISFKFDIQTHSIFDSSKIVLPELQKFGVKQGFEHRREVNNFLHKSFFRFRMDLKLKI
jgi:hypothetical protein